MLLITFCGSRSLECKLESLKAEKENCCHLGYGSSRTASPVPILTSERVESSGKETSKDGLSAGSFSQIPESVAEMSRHPDSDSSEQEKISAIKKSVDEISESSKQEKLPGNENLAETSNEQGVTLLQKRRGKRKRKDYYNREPRELSVGESENLGSTNVVENSTSECGPMVRSSSMNDYEIGSCGVGNGDLRDIFTSVAENKYGLVFRRRLDSQVISCTRGSPTLSSPPCNETISVTLCRNQLAVYLQLFMFAPCHVWVFCDLVWRSYK